MKHFSVPTFNLLLLQIVKLFTPYHLIAYNLQVSKCDQGCMNQGLAVVNPGKKT